MGAEEIRTRYKFLKDILDLPDGDRQLGFCSGGQQRRVSFAAAMVHTPELLILDEPTVGLDPVLRERIWDYLIEETKSTKLAVIITTHYIDETKKATKIGLMRAGVLLAEESPQNLLNTYNTTSLEDAFLKLCLKQGTDDEAHDDTAVKDVVVVHTAANAAATHLRNSNNNIRSSSTHIISKDDHPKKTVTSSDLAAIDQHAVTNNNGNNNKNGALVNGGSNGDATREKPVFRDCNYDRETERRPSIMDKMQFTSKTRMKALLAKNFIQMIRQPA